MPWVGLVLPEGVRLALEVQTWQDWGQETRGDVTRDFGLQRPLQGITHWRPPTNSGVCDVSTAGVQGREEPQSRGQARYRLWGGWVSNPCPWALFSRVP